MKPRRWGLWDESPSVPRCPSCARDAIEDGIMAWAADLGLWQECCTTCMAKIVLHSHFEQACASSPLFSLPFFGLTSCHTQLKGLAATCQRRQVSEAQQAERERIKFAVPANGSWQTLGREMTFYWSQRLHHLTIHSCSVPLGRH